MNIVALEIENFLTIGTARLSLANKGLVLIQGENLADTSAVSNGVGKSSLVDALCWGNYGTTARDVSGDEVVNNKAKKNCRVRSTWQDGVTLYSVARHRKHATHKNQTVLEQSVDGGATWTDLSRGTEKETQEEIVKILGCSLEVFKGSIYCGQEEAPDLPKMTDKQLKLLVEEAAGVERLEGAYRIAMAVVNGSKVKLAGVISKRDGLISQVERGRLELAARKIDQERFEAERPIRAKTHTISAATLKADMVAMAGQIKASGEEEKRVRVAAINAELAEHGKKADAVTELTHQVMDARRIFDRAVSALTDRVNDVKGLQATLANAAEEMKKPCAECGKPHTAEEADSYQKRLGERIAEKTSQAKATKTTVDAARAKLDDAVRQHAAGQAALPDVSDLTSETARLQAEIAAVERLKAQLMTKKRDYDRLQELAAAEMTKANPFDVAVDGLSKGVESLAAEIAAATDLIGASEEELQVAESVAKVFSPAGVRAHILDTVTPFLNDRTADYLSALSDGNISAVWTTLGETAKGELREKFNIDVENEKGAKSFKGLSGGEKRKVRLATMLALQDLVASRASKPIDLYMGDEIDDALDRAGLERLMTILERKARERGTVLIVSHNDLRDWIDNVCTVTKHPDEVSTIDGALVA